MRALLFAVPVLAAGCSNLFSPDDGDFEFTGYELVFRVDATETVAGEPVPYTAWLVDENDEPAPDVEWNLTSDIEPDLAWGQNELTAIVAGDHLLTMTTVYEGITYTDDAAPLLERLHQSALCGDTRPIVRPTNLEDVFLAVAGARLEEGDA